MSELWYDSLVKNGSKKSVIVLDEFQTCEHVHEPVNRFTCQVLTSVHEIIQDSKLVKISGNQLSSRALHL